MDDRERIQAAIDYAGLAQRHIRRRLESLSAETAASTLPESLTMALVYLGKSDAMFITGEHWRYAVMGLQRAIECMGKLDKYQELVRALEHADICIKRMMADLESER